MRLQADREAIDELSKVLAQTASGRDLDLQLASPSLAEPCPSSLPGATNHGPHGLVTCRVLMDASPRQIQVKTRGCSFLEESLLLTRSNKENSAD